MVKVKTSRAGMVECCGKRYYFNKGVVLNVPESCEADFLAFSEGLDLLSERERKLLSAAGISTPEEVLEHEDLTSISGIGESTANSIQEKLNG